MRERPNRTVSKTVVLKGTVGSNPTLSATQNRPYGLLLSRRSAPAPCSKNRPVAPTVASKSYRLRFPSRRVSRPAARPGSLPPPLVVYSPPPDQGSLWSTQEGRMFEQTESALVMTLLALGGIALMADEKLGSTCLHMVKWIRTRGRL